MMKLLLLSVCLGLGFMILEWGKESERPTFAKCEAAGGTPTRDESTYWGWSCR